MSKNCKNPKCRDRLQEWERKRWLCPSCRFLARWAFILGAGLAGVLFSVLKFLGAIQ